MSLIERAHDENGQRSSKWSQNDRAHNHGFLVSTHSLQKTNDFLLATMKIRIFVELLLVLPVVICTNFVERLSLISAWGHVRSRAKPFQEARKTTEQLAHLQKQISNLGETVERNNRRVIETRSDIENAFNRQVDQTESKLWQQQTSITKQATINRQLFKEQSESVSRIDEIDKEQSEMLSRIDHIEEVLKEGGITNPLRGFGLIAFIIILSCLAGIVELFNQ